MLIKELDIDIFKNIKIDFYYVIIFFLMAIKLYFFPAYNPTHIYSQIMIYTVIIFLLLNIFNEKNFLFIFIFCYFCNVSKWFTLYKLTGNVGSRVLFIDILLPIFFLFIVNNLGVKVSKEKKVLFFKVFMLLMLIWLFNFLRGMLGPTAGHALGESRFYLFSFVMIMIVKMNIKEIEFLKLVKLIYYASLIWASKVYLSIVLFFDQFIAGDIARFAPSGYGVLIITFGYNIVLYSILNKKDFVRIFGVTNKFIIVFLLGSILLSGIRTTIIITFISTFVIFYFTYKDSISKFIKVFFVVGLITVIYALFASNEFVTLFVGNVTESSTMDWRLQVWLVFLQDSFSTLDRALLGRPFGLSLIDVSSIGYNDWTLADSSVAHNDFISFHMTNGIIFTVLFITYMILILKEAFKYIFKSDDHRKSLLVLYTTFFISQILQSATNAENRHYGASLTLWIFMGLITNYLNMKNKEEAEKEEEKSDESASLNPVLNNS